jgi:uncharacterized protein (TIGR02246 family)
MKRHAQIASVILSCVAVLTAACAGTRALGDSDEAAIRTADQAWSKAVQSKQIDASLAFSADDATTLPPNEPMAKGKDAIRKLYEGMFATPGFSISWQVNKVEAAKSGDIGYSMGAYDMTMNDPKGNPMKDHGKYLTVWRKQADGSWKSIADMFNSDVPIEPPPASK